MHEKVKVPLVDIGVHQDRHELQPPDFGVLIVIWWVDAFFGLLAFSLVPFWG